MKINDYKAREEICQYVKANYNTIKVKPGKCRFNFKCHMNSTHEAKRNNHKKLAMCIYIDEGYPIIHFVNYHKGKFVDNTLGEWITQVDCYFIKWVKQKEMFTIEKIFTAFSLELRKNLNWWTRLTSEYGG